MEDELAILLPGQLAANVRACEGAQQEVVRRNVVIKRNAVIKRNVVIKITKKWGSSHVAKSLRLEEGDLSERQYGGPNQCAQITPTLPGKDLSFKCQASNSKYGMIYNIYILPSRQTALIVPT